VKCRSKVSEQPIKPFIGYIRVRVLDAEFPPELQINKQSIGFYFHVGKKLEDVNVLSDQSRVKIAVRKNNSEDKLVIVVKSLGESEERYGSISFALEAYFGTASDMVVAGQRYIQWITLFDHPDDDVYDGVLGEDDEETPRIRVEFSVEDAS
jgi:hypothetical protein